jgi:prophage antirepressor-like protein
MRDAWMVNESGLYHLILTSTKPEAKTFRKWVTNTVLPSIRKAGKYTTEEAQNKELELQRLAKNIEDKEKEITDAKSILKTLTSDREQLYAELRDTIRRNPNQLRIDLKSE